ncbi:hypothetical protein SCUCBS95973_006822 [Sporothrix curviconia]|uniref:Uncharacterized protein n=1 Tax=Sporothrix curviconia TaxID=1260050 RepID=A0ABP0C8D7_9PEZI
MSLSPPSPAAPGTPTGSTIAIPQPSFTTSWLSLDIGHDDDDDNDDNDDYDYDDDGDDDDDDDDDHPLGFHIDCDPVSEIVASTSAETDTIAATTLCGDERTINSDGDASTVRGILIPAHPLTDFSNLLGLQASMPPRSIVTQDSSSTIRQTIGSRRSNNANDTAAQYVADPSRLSYATTVDQDNDDLYGWEAELEHRKSNSCSAVTRPPIVDDLRRSINRNAHSNSSSSSNSVMSSSSEREASGRRQGEARTHRQSFFQRVFSGKSIASAIAPASGRGDRNAATPRTSSSTRVSAAGASMASTSLAESSQSSTHAGQFPSMPQLATLLSNYTTMRDSNRL